jgi:D-3-phosphoglycerate dehydrogenase
MAEKILVTPRSVTAKGHPALEKLTQAGFEVVFCSPGVQPTEEELIRLLPDCVGYLAGVEKVGEKAIASALKLKVISRNGTGVDNVDAEACKRQNIRICRAEGANAQGVAELAIALMLSLARSIPFSDKGIKTGGWERRTGFELPGKTLGLMGCGKIGKIVARLASACRMKVLAHDPYPDKAFTLPDFEWVDADRVFSQADVLSLHCPPLKNGKSLLDKDMIIKLKKGICIINTARADLLDEEAVLQALESGHIAGLGMDVFREEPPKDRRLASHPRVIATPHIGGLTVESIDRAISVAVDNLLEALR